MLCWSTILRYHNTSQYCHPEEQTIHAIDLTLIATQCLSHLIHSTIDSHIEFSHQILTSTSHIDPHIDSHMDSDAILTGQGLFFSLSLFSFLFGSVSASLMELTVFCQSKGLQVYGTVHVFRCYHQLP